MTKFRGFLIAASLALCACAPNTSADGGLPNAPGDLADATVLDEQTALSVELAYQAAGLAVKSAADAGVLHGDAAAKAAKLDRQAYGAVRAVRDAYDAGNADSYAQAAVIARKQIAAILALIR